MMTLPFFAAFAAMIAAWMGRRTLALALWAATLVALLVLLRLHATDALPISL